MVLFTLCMTCIYKIWMCGNILVNIFYLWHVCSCILYWVLFIHTMHLWIIKGKKYSWYFLCMTYICKIWMCCNILVIIFYLWHMFKYTISIFVSVVCIYKTLRLRNIFDILFLCMTCIYKICICCNILLNIFYECLLMYSILGFYP